MIKYLKFIQNFQKNVLGSQILVSELLLINYCKMLMLYQTWRVPTINKNGSHNPHHSLVPFSLLSTPSCFSYHIMSHTNLPPENNKMEQVNEKILSMQKKKKYSMWYITIVNCSKSKDLVHIIPTKSMKAETLFTLIKLVITGLEQNGFRVNKHYHTFVSYQICQLCINTHNRVQGFSFSCLTQYI